MSAGPLAVRLLHWIVTLPAAVVAVVFAVSNRETVTVSFWPLPSQHVRLYLVVLLAMLAGFLIGEFVAWTNGARARRLARERARRLAALERELAATQAMTTAVPTAAKASASLALPGQAEKLKSPATSA